VQAVVAVMATTLQAVLAAQVAAAQVTADPGLRMQF
jgi:hypothetical protein